MKAKRHHYLPVFFLNGFTSTEGLFHVYDKEKDCIYFNQNPKSQFYINGLNDLNLDGKFMYTFENPFFSDLDHKTSILLKKILIGQKTDILERLYLLDFLFFLFWRLPHSDEHFKKLIQNKELNNDYFNINLRSENDEMVDKIKELFFEKHSIFKYLIPIGSSLKIDRFYQVENWSIMKLNNTEYSFITGDFPFLSKNKETLKEFTIPLGNKILLSTMAPFPDFLSGELFHRINICTLLQSKRFVASNDESYLKELLDAYRLIISKGEVDNYISRTLEIISQPI